VTRLELATFRCGVNRNRLLLTLIHFVVDKLTDRSYHRRARHLESWALVAIGIRDETKEFESRFLIRNGILPVEVVMRQSKTGRRRSRVLVVTVVCICAVVLGTGWMTRKGANRPPQQNSAPRLQNRTRSFEVLQIKLEDRGVVLTLKNGYTKNITAFAVSVNRSSTQTDFLYSEGEDWSGIAPGAVHTINVGMERSSNPEVAAQEGINIRVLAVVFDDRTSDGDQKMAAEILDMREGSKIQLTRIIGLVDRELKSTAPVDDGAVNHLRSQISALPIESPDSVTESTSLRSQKYEALRRLDDQANSSVETARERMIRLKAACEELLARL
jgi:hypothetical protein